MRSREFLVMVVIITLIVIGSLVSPERAYGWSRCHLIGCYDFGECTWPPGIDKWIGHYYCPDKSYPWRSAGPWCCYNPCCPEWYYFEDP